MIAISVIGLAYVLIHNWTQLKLSCVPRSCSTFHPPAGANAAPSNSPAAFRGHSGTQRFLREAVWVWKLSRVRFPPSGAPRASASWGFWLWAPEPTSSSTHKMLTIVERLTTTFDTVHYVLLAGPVDALRFRQVWDAEIRRLAGWLHRAWSGARLRPWQDRLQWPQCWLCRGSHTTPHTCRPDCLQLGCPVDRRASRCDRHSHWLLTLFLLWPLPISPVERLQFFFGRQPTLPGVWEWSLVVCGRAFVVRSHLQTWAPE